MRRKHAEPGRPVTLHELLARYAVEQREPIAVARRYGLPHELAHRRTPRALGDVAADHHQSGLRAGFEEGRRGPRECLDALALLKPADVQHFLAVRRAGVGLRG